MTDKEYNDYKLEIESSYGECTIFKSISCGMMTNAKNTGEIEAYKGIDWIDYWRAMTGNHNETLCCSSCGKEITNNPSLAQYVSYSQGDDTPEKHRAFGGHIWMTFEDNGSFASGRFITPLCPKCNDQRGKSIVMRKGIILCKEIGAKKN